MLVACTYGALVMFHLVMKLGQKRIKLLFLHGCGKIDGTADKKSNIMY